MLLTLLVGVNIRGGLVAPVVLAQPLEGNTAVLERRVLFSKVGVNVVSVDTNRWGTVAHSRGVGGARVERSGNTGGEGRVSLVERGVGEHVERVVLE